MNMAIGYSKKIISWTVANSVYGYNKTEADLQKKI